jgi:hypothetical protein
MSGPEASKKTYTGTDGCIEIATTLPSIVNFSTDSTGAL